jgi:hypothetical protein
VKKREDPDRKLGEIGGERAFASSVEGALECSHVTVRDERGNEGITVQFLE